jgi:uncharacterized protein
MRLGASHVAGALQRKTHQQTVDPATIGLPGLVAIREHSVLCISRDHPAPRYASNVTQVAPTIDGLRACREAILSAAHRRHASRVRVFGSIARGSAGPSSDVDLLVDFDAEASLLDQVGLTQDLEALLGMSVDVISSGGLLPRHRRIRDEAIDL